MGWSAFSLTRPDGTDFDLIDHLGTLPVDLAPHQVRVRARLAPRDAVRASAGPGFLPLRLIIRRKTPEATEATRKELFREASRKQKTLDLRSLVAAEFVIPVDLAAGPG